MRWFLSLILAILISAACTQAAGAQGNKVTFRDDYTALVDGKPFFPIGLYYASEEFEELSGKLLRELRGYGFNTLGYYRWGQPTWRQELDRAGEAGFKVWIRGENGFAIDNAKVEKAALEQIRHLREHPALLFWEFQDEPILNKVSVDASRKGYQLVKREDPNHPMLVVEWPGAADRFEIWKGIGDVFATDLYPIPRERKYGLLPNHDITQMRDYLEALGKAHPDKPRMLVVQGWAWAPLKDGEKGYPTPVESRFMAYYAVMHGAKGLFYYGQVHCSRPNAAAGLAAEAKDEKVRQRDFETCKALNRRFWDKHKEVIKELSEASAIFVLRGAKPDDRLTLVQQVPEDKTGFESLTKQGDKGIYVLAVNAASKHHAVKLQLPPSAKNVKEVHVLFEKRKIRVSEGVFTDQFRPYERHVYATTATLPTLEASRR